MRKYASFQIYQIAKELGVPINRSLLGWLKTSGKFKSKGEYFRFSLFSKNDVIQILMRVAERRKIQLTENDILSVMERFKGIS